LPVAKVKALSRAAFCTFPVFLQSTTIEMQLNIVVVQHIFISIGDHQTAHPKIKLTMLFCIARWRFLLLSCRNGSDAADKYDKYTLS
jgi:hypothetical protein